MANLRSASPAPVAGSRLFTPAFIALTLSEFAYFSAQGLEIPLAPLFASRVLGADEIGVGVVVGALSVTALVLRPFAGRISDRRGRRRLLIGGALLYALATLAHAVAPSLAVMVGLRLALGVAEAFFFVAAFAALADLAPPGRIGEALSVNSTALYLGIAVGPLVGQVLLENGGFTIAWIGAASLALVAAIVATRVPETADRTTAEVADPPLIHPAAVVPGLALLTGIAAMAGFFAFLALYAESIEVTDWSLVLLEFGLLVIATRLVFAKVPDRVPPFRLGAAALALTGLGIGIVGVAPTPVGLYLGAGVAAIGVAFTTPAFFTAVIAGVGQRERGAAMATMTVAIDLAFGVGPMTLGVVAAIGGIPVAFLAASALALVGAAGAGLVARRGAVSTA